jgi:hypothetical protein
MQSHQAQSDIESERKNLRPVCVDHIMNAVVCGYGKTHATWKRRSKRIAFSVQGRGGEAFFTSWFDSHLCFAVSSGSLALTNPSYSITNSKILLQKT